MQPKGLDLVEIITNAKYDIANNVLYSLIGITAVQIGLTDVLKAIGVIPDFIIGMNLFYENNKKYNKKILLKKH